MNLIDLSRPFQRVFTNSNWLIAKIGVDTAENESSKVCQKVVRQFDRLGLLRPNIGLLLSLPPDGGAGGLGRDDPAGAILAVHGLVRMLRINCFGLRVLRVHSLTLIQDLRRREFTHILGRL